MRGLGISGFQAAGEESHLRAWAADAVFPAALADMALLHAENAPTIYLRTRCKVGHVCILACGSGTAGRRHLF